MSVLSKAEGKTLVLLGSKLRTIPLKSNFHLPAVEEEQLFDVTLLE